MTRCGQNSYPPPPPLVLKSHISCHPHKTITS
jgi:hypothetical protein